MKPDRISVVNFRSIASKTWVPAGRLTAVTGPNGVGKSSLFADAACFALYGVVPDGASPDELVRVGATDMSVTLELTVDGQAYRVIRRRTTRAGGKSSADLQVRASDGEWKPVASGADAVTAEAERLMRMDPATFRTVVVIAQGDAKRFLDAPAGKGSPKNPGKAAILSTLVVDPRFELVEVRARDEMRTLEATSAADRSSAERLGDAIEELAFADEAKARREQELAEYDETIAEDKRRRVEVSARLTALAAEIATGDAAAAEVARLEAERTTLADRYRRERATVTAAAAVLEKAEDVAIATAALPGKRAELEVLVTAEATDRTRAQEIADRRRAFEPLERELREGRATWTAELRAAQARVTELQVSLAALEPVVCRKCGTANVVDQADLGGQLVAARVRVTELEAAEPNESMAHSRERAAIKRLEEKLADDPFDRVAFVQLQAEVAAYEKVAARAEAIAAAETSKADAEAELVKIGEAGKAIAERIGVATAATSTTKALIEEQTDLSTEARRVDEAIDLVERHRRQSADALATAIAHLERRDQLEEERRTTLGRLEETTAAVARLKRVIADAGVKGIPARVVKTVLPELVAHANEFLGQLIPGMTLDLRATRAKADGSGTIEALEIWIRDHRGERQRWSGGQGTSIALSIAVALSRIGARRSGARVAWQVIDEPDGLDVDARRALGFALKELAHRGDLEVVVVITHQDGIPDFADDVVELEPDGEPIALVA